MDEDDKKRSYRKAKKNLYSHAVENTKEIHCMKRTISWWWSVLSKYEGVLHLLRKSNIFLVRGETEASQPILTRYEKPERQMSGVLCQEISESWKLCIRKVFEICSALMFYCQRSFSIKGAIVF